MIGTVKLKATYSLHLTNTCRCGDTSGYPVALLERDELPLSRSDLTTLLLNVERSAMDTSEGDESLKRVWKIRVDEKVKAEIECPFT
ncbi:hypothetical protein D5086_009154 [Populus alba]|uniref:Uncharacterized protein n=1 Tax=Populus alba TaxID=43335 RepID=A0ACC4CIT3_POPAL